MTTVTRSLSKTEARVLHAMRLRDDVQAKETERDIERGFVRRDELADPSRCLQGLPGILGLARSLVTRGRPPSEREVYNALQRLVARGLVESDRVVGMGGGLTLYIRREEES